ncbi:MAG: hypothetical protein AAFR53_08625 [Pseudomonadota bacterium]
MIAGCFAALGLVGLLIFSNLVREVARDPKLIIVLVLALGAVYVALSFSGISISVARVE